MLWLAVAERTTLYQGRDIQTKKKNRKDVPTASNNVRVKSKHVQGSIKVYKKCQGFGGATKRPIITIENLTNREQQEDKGGEVEEVTEEDDGEEQKEEVKRKKTELKRRRGR